MKSKSKPQRWRFLRDNDGHDYLVKDEEAQLFDDLLDAASCDDEAAQNEFSLKFDDCRIGRHPSGYSFVDPATD